MDKLTMTEIKELFLYDVHFDATMTDDTDDDLYDEIVYYDGGKVEGYDPEGDDKNKNSAYFMVEDKV